MNTLVWLRNELRWHDNPMLIQAHETEKPCYFLYILDQKLLLPAIPEIKDFNRIGMHRLRFIKESFDAFNLKLKRQNNTLIFKIGRPTEIIQNTITAYNISELIISEQFAAEECLDNSLLQEYFGSTIKIHIINTSTVFKQADLPFEIEQLPHTFSAFNRKTETATPGILSVSEDLIFKSPLKSPPPSDDWPAITPAWRINNTDFSFNGSEEEALQRLNYYVFDTKYINKYKEQRNGLIGSDFSSRFSPWLANGSLSSIKAYTAITDFENQYGSNDGTQALKYELKWREFFYWNAKKQSIRLFHRNGFNGRYSKGCRDVRKFNDWRNAQSSESFVNAGMKELSSTGWISNRIRQNVASFLLHDLEIDWRWGAYWFEHQLIDYDPAINWGNWAYIAGVGNDTQAIRKFHIQKQQEWYDPGSGYTKLWTES
jgi:deoxyribodipyrimidine photo-lyase